MQRPIGLELKVQTVPQEVLVIDHAEKPAQSQAQSTRAIVPSFEAVTIKPNKTGRANVGRPRVLREMGFGLSTFISYSPAGKALKTKLPSASEVVMTMVAFGTAPPLGSRMVPVNFPDKF